MASEGRAPLATLAIMILVFASSASLVLTPGCERDAAVDRKAPGGGGEKRAGASSTAALESLLARADALAAKSRHVEAARSVRAGLAGLDGAERVRALARIASEYSIAGTDSSALEFARLAVEAGADAPDTLAVYGESLRRMERNDEAIAVLDRLLAKSPRHARGALSKASIEWRRGKLDAALTHFDVYFEEASSDERNAVEALLEHGRALRAKGEHASAAGRFLDVLEREPLDALAHSELAQTLFRLRKREEGKHVQSIYSRLMQSDFERHVEERLEESGAVAFAFVQRALNLTRQKRLGEALLWFERAIGVGSSDSRVAAYFADSLLELSRPTQASQLTRQALTAGAAPRSGLYWTLARAEIDRRESLAAFEAAGRGLEAHAAEGGGSGGVEKGRAPLFSLLLYSARSALEAARLDAAEQSCARALSIAPESWEPFYWRGRVAHERGDVRAASRDYEEALRRGGRFEDLVLWSALALEALGNRVAARTTRLVSVARAVPTHLKAHEELARLENGAPIPEIPDFERRLAALRSFDATREHIESAIDTKPSLRDCGVEYLELGEALLTVGDRSGMDLLFLAADLLPADPRPPRKLLAVLRNRDDVFVRLHLLRRLLAAVPGDNAVAQEIESLRVAHGAAPRPVSPSSGE